MYFLAGLPTEYSVAVSTITSRNDLSFQEVIAMLLSQETRLEQLRPTSRC